MRRTYGRANKCEVCLLETEFEDKKRTFTWANISGNYKQDRDDWKMMCYSCHKKFDMRQKGFSVWNKGKKTGIVTKGSFRKGTEPWNKGVKTGQIPSTVFKKGNIPWNKGLYLKKEKLI